jgi:dTDP-L-rhamnose 4-epimerase
MNILITGGLGFIGARLGQSLLRDGHDVILLDSLSTQIHGDIPQPFVPEGARVCRLDVRELTEHTELLEGVDAVYHLAAETGTAQSMYRIRHYVDVNAIGTASLLEAIAKCRKRPRHLILASSRSVYGEGAYRSQDGDKEIIQPQSRTRDRLKNNQWEHYDEAGRMLVPIASPESLLPNPGSVYAATKLCQEMLVVAAAHAIDLKCTVLRLQNVYGEGQSLSNPYTGIISIFFNRARQALDIPVYEDGKESRDFVHVDDVVGPLKQLLHVDIPSGTVINIGSGVPISVFELASTLVGVSGFPVAVHVTGQYRLGDIRHCYADLTKAERLLHFAPQVTLKEGLRRFCAWASTQPVHADLSDMAAAELRSHGLSNA